VLLYRYFVSLPLSDVSSCWFIVKSVRYCYFTIISSHLLFLMSVAVDSPTINKIVLLYYYFPHLFFPMSVAVDSLYNQ